MLMRARSHFPPVWASARRRSSSHSEGVRTLSITVAYMSEYSGREVLLKSILVTFGVGAGPFRKSFGRLDGPAGIAEEDIVVV